MVSDRRAAPRLMQSVDGHVVMIVNGEVTYRDGTPTSALLPGYSRHPTGAGLRLPQRVHGLKQQVATRRRCRRRRFRTCDS